MDDNVSAGQMLVDEILDEIVRDQRDQRFSLESGPGGRGATQSGSLSGRITINEKRNSGVRRIPSAGSKEPSETHIHSTVFDQAGEGVSADIEHANIQPGPGHCGIL